MRVIFMGTPDFSVPVLDALHTRYEVIAVYCQPPRPAGRGKQPRPSPVQARAEALGLPVRHPLSLRNPDAQAEFAALDADVAVVVAYGLILPQRVLDAPRHGCLNIHASLLPRWRGAAPIQRAIMAGDAETGVCIMQMDAGLDTGAVLLRATTPITGDDTAASLHDRLSVMGARLILRALADLPDLVPQPQPEAGITYAAKIDKAEARIDWQAPAELVARRIRALSPFPGAWCDTPAGRLKLLQAHALPVSAASAMPGTVMAQDTPQALVIACGAGAVAITLAQREGKRPLPAGALLRGLDLPPGTRLGG
ncbi:MAG: methionyl-tRNA formyltransferase [Pararhodobacter sp.]